MKNDEELRYCIFQLVMVDKLKFKNNARGCSSMNKTYSINLGVTVKTTVKCHQAKKSEFV